MNILRPVCLTIAGLGIVIGAAACGPAHTTAYKVNASQSAQAKSDAKSLAECLPQNSLAQLQLIKSLDTAKGRDQLVAMCGIAPNKKQAFEAAVLSAAESGHLTTSAGRNTFVTVTLPQLVKENQ
jgi:hypothetical protein